MDQERQELEDQILVMDAQDGNRQAMESLVERWQRRLWLHAYRLAGDPEDAWDITQQAWIGAIKGLRRLQDPSRFRAWIFRIATHKAFDLIRRKSSQKTVGLDQAQDLPPEGKQRIRAGDVHELLGRLDPRRRAVILLHYFEELPIDEIAAALRIPAGTVKSRLHTARLELKRLMQESTRQGVDP